MTIASELAQLLQRDLQRLAQELREIPEDKLWETLPGVENSAGNLAQHLEGNLREYIGRQLGGVDYVRQRDLEFSSQDPSAEELIRRIEHLERSIPSIVAALPADVLDATYPEVVLGTPLTTQQFLIHLYGHFSYHLGQIDYLRRILTAGTAIKFSALR